MTKTGVAGSRDRMRRALSILAGIIISAAFLYLAFRKISLREFWQYGSNITTWPLVCACAIHPLRFVFTTLRWGVFLRPAKKISLRRLFPIIAVSFAANNVLPLRSGEAVRVLLLRQREDVSMSVSVSTVLVERFADLATLLALLFVVGSRIPVPLAMRDAARSLVVVCGIGSACICLALVLRRPLTEIAGRYLSKHPGRLGIRIEELAGKFMTGMSALASPRSILLVLVYSFASWAIEAQVYFFVAQSFHLPISYAQSVFIMVCAALVVLVPSSPGYVGVFEWTVTTVLVGFAIDRNAAVAYAVACHLALLLPITLLGWFYAVRLSLARHVNVVALEADSDAENLTQRSPESNHIRQ